MASGLSGPPLESRRDEGAAAGTATESAIAPEPLPQLDSHEPGMCGQGVHATRMRDSSEPKRTKTTFGTDTENLGDRVDEDNFQRTPTTSHPLEPVDDGNVSKKAGVARNVLHFRGEDTVKFDVNGEAWPNADLAIRAKSTAADLSSA